MANALSWAGVTSPSSWASTGAGTSGDDPDCTTSGPISSTTDRKRTEGAVGCEFGVGAGVCVGDVGAGATTTAGGSAGACGSEVPAWTSVGALGSDWPPAGEVAIAKIGTAEYRRAPTRWTGPIFLAWMTPRGDSQDKFGRYQMAGGKIGDKKWRKIE